MRIKYTPYWLLKIQHWLFLRHLWYPVDSIGIQFSYMGDTVWWTWPWKRKGRGKYLSLEFTGTGEFGDARFSSLKELKTLWEGFFDACEVVDKRELKDDTDDF